MFTIETFQHPLKDEMLRRLRAGQGIKKIAAELHIGGRVVRLCRDAAGLTPDKARADRVARARP